MSNTRNILDALGGAAAVATALELPLSTVTSWIYKAKQIPRWHMKLLVQLAAEKGVDLDALPESEAA